MALSANDAATIAGYFKLRGGIAPGANDTATVAAWIRSHWGGTGTDAAVIVSYAESKSDIDLVNHAAHLRLHFGST